MACGANSDSKLCLAPSLSRPSTLHHHQHTRTRTRAAQTKNATFYIIHSDPIPHILLFIPSFALCILKGASEPPACLGPTASESIRDTQTHSQERKGSVSVVMDRAQLEEARSSLVAPANDLVTVSIICADGCENEILVNRECMGRDIWSCFTSVFDLNEQDFFGLVYQVPKERSENPYIDPTATGGFQWLILDEPAEPQLGKPKLSEDGTFEVWEMSFRIKFYVGHEQTALWDDYARYLFFLQLNHDMSHGRLVVEDSVRAELLGFAAQVECGDWDPATHATTDYFEEYEIIPPTKLPFNSDGILLKAIGHHKKCRGMTTAAAQTAFIALAQDQSMYGVDLYNCKTESGKAVQIGVAPSGINLYEESAIQRHTWSQIKNIQFRRERFTLTFRSRKIADSDDVGKKTNLGSFSVLFTSKVTCKAMWKSSIQHHTFFRRKSSARTGLGSKKHRGKADAIALSVGTTMQEALSNTIKRSTTTPEEGTLRERLSHDVTATVNRAAHLSAGGERLRTVVVRRNAGNDFGFKIIGPAEDDARQGIFVSEINDSRVRASKGSVLDTGDKIVSSNGVNLLTASLDDAFDSFTRARQILVLDVVSSRQAFAIARTEYKRNKEDDVIIGSNAFQRRSTKKRKSTFGASVHRKQSRRSTGFMNSEIRKRSKPSHSELQTHDETEEHEQNNDSTSHAGDGRGSLDARQHAVAVNGSESWTTGLEHTVNGTVYSELMENIVLDTSKQKNLGISIAGGVDTPVVEGDNAIYVQKVLSGGIAAQDGRISEADRLREINGSRLDAIQHDDAVSMLQHGLLGNQLNLLVSRLVPKSQVTREQQFHGRHGLIKRTVSKQGTLVSFQPGAMRPLFPCAAPKMHLIRDSSDGERATWQAQNSTDVTANGGQATTLRKQGLGGAIVRSSPLQGDTSSLVVCELECHPDKGEEIGIALVGNTDRVDCGGCFVSAVYAGSPASLCFSLQRGMKLVDINGWHVENVSTTQALQLLSSPSSSAESVKIVLQSDPAAFERVRSLSDSTHYKPLVPTGVSAASLQSRVINCSRSRITDRWGITLLGAEGAPDPADYAIFVSKVDATLVSATGAGLQVGDQILDINGVCCNGVPHAAALQALKAAGLSATFKVVSNPAGMRTFSHEMKKRGIAIFEAAADTQLRAIRIAKPAGDRKQPFIDIEGPSHGASVKDGVFVTKIHNPAAKQSGLSVGDQLVEINGVSVLSATKASAEALIAKFSVLELVVTSNPAGFSRYKLLACGYERRVTLLRGAQGFGFTACGPSSKGHGYPGVYVASIAKAAPLEVKANLSVGDEIIAVNGKDTTCATLPGVEKLLMEASSVVLTVTHNPSGFEPYKRDAIKKQESIRRAELRKRHQGGSKTGKTAQVVNVTLVRSTPKTAWGMRLRGPVHADDERSGVFVQDIKERSAAASERNLCSGDRIMRVNGQDVMLSTVPEVMSILGEDSYVCELLLAKPSGSDGPDGTQAASSLETDDRNARLVPVDCSGGVDVGVSLVGGTESGNTSVFISIVHANGPAHKAGSVNPGDQLLAVNGSPVAGKSVQQVEDLLAASNHSVLMRLLYNPEGFKQHEQAVAKVKKQAMQKVISPVDLRHVQLEGSPDSVGVVLGGFSEMRAGMQRSGVFVASVAKGGLGDAAGLRKGDQLVEVSGAGVDDWLSLATRSVEFATAHIRATLEEVGSVSLVVAENMEGYLYYSALINANRLRFVLERPSATAPLGFDVAAKLPADSTDTSLATIYISDIIAGSNAAKAGLRPGLVLSEVNGVCVEKQDLHACINVLTEATGHVSLVLQEPAKLPFLPHPTTPSSSFVDLSRKQALSCTKVYSSTHALPLEAPAQKEDQDQQGSAHAAYDVPDASSVGSSKRPSLSTATHQLEFTHVGATQQGQVRQSVGSGVQAGSQACTEEVTVLGSSDSGKARAVPGEPRGSGSVRNPSPLSSAMSAPSSRRPTSSDDLENVPSLRKEGSMEGANGAEKRSRDGHWSHSTPLLQLRQSGYPDLPFHVRALYDFDTADDDDTLLPFKTGAILQVHDVSDPEYWVASDTDAADKVGRIPSRSRREKDFMMTKEYAEMCERAGCTTSVFSEAQGKQADRSMQPKYTIRSYQVVVQKKPSQQFRRPLAIIGPESLRITDAIRQVLPKISFVNAIPHTTRPMREGERDGVDYHFIDAETMDRYLAEKRFVEAGRYKGNMYGTSLEAITEPAAQGHVVLLDTQLKAIQRLQQFGQVYPVVILLKPSSVPSLYESLVQAAKIDGTGAQVEKSTAEALFEATSATEREYQHLFTHIIATTADLAATVKQVAKVVASTIHAPFWANTFHDLPLHSPSEFHASSIASRTAKSLLSRSGTQASVDTGMSDESSAISSSNIGNQAANHANGNGSSSNNNKKRRKNKRQQATYAKSYTPETVVIARNDNGSFGFSVAGGVEDDLLPAIVLKRNITPIVVRGEELSKGDEIIAVNGVNVAGESHEQVINLIKNAGEEVTLTLFKRKPNQAYRRVSDLVTMPSSNSVEGMLQNQVKQTLYTMTIPVTSRPKLPDEQNGVDYMFVSEAEFEDMIMTGKLLEWGKNKGHYYGTKKVHPNELQTNRKRQRTKTFRDAMKNKERKGTRVNTVTLQRKPNGSFGINFHGGIEHDELPTITVLDSPRVLKATYGNIQVGDCILSINGENVGGSTHASVKHMIAAAGDTVELLILCKEAAAETSRGFSHRRSVRHFLAPSLHDDDDMKALKKDTLLKIDPVYDYNVPFTTRAPRDGEEDGVHFHFLSREAFEACIQNDQLEEWAEHDGTYYGTAKAPNQQQLSSHAAAREDASKPAFSSRSSLANESSKGATSGTSVDVLMKQAATSSGPQQRASVAKLPMHANANAGTNVDSPCDGEKPYTVTMSKGESGFGFNIIDIADKPYTGIYISEVRPGSSADVEGELMCGMKVHAINGQDVVNATRDEVAVALRSTGDYISLLVSECNSPLLLEKYLGMGHIGRFQRNQRHSLRARRDSYECAADVRGRIMKMGGENIRTVSLQKTLRGYGLKIAKEDSLGVVIITAIMDFCEARDDLQEGDVIFQLDEHPVDALQHHDVLQILKSRDRVFLVVATLPITVSIAEDAEAQAEADAAPNVAREGLDRDNVSGIPGHVSQRRVHLTKGPAGFGISLISDDQQQTPVPRVASVMKGSVAYNSEKVYFGDRILKVNDTHVVGMDHDDVVEMLRSSNEVTLLLEDDHSPLPSSVPAARYANQQPPSVDEDFAASDQADYSDANAADADSRVSEEADDFHEIVLHRGTNGFGMTIITDEANGTVRVADIRQDTPAYEAMRHGDMNVGDRVLTINGQALDGFTHEDVIAVLTQATAASLVLMPDSSPLPVAEDIDDDILQVEDLRTAHLVKSNIGFGMKVSSPADNDIGACITKIIEGSPAALAGNVHTNDVIVSINGENLLEWRHDDIIALLRECTEIDITLSSDISLLGLALVPELRTVTLERNQFGFGMTITTDERSGVVRITAVTDDGPAIASELVFVGDIIKEINGELMDGKTHEDVISHLTGAEKATLVLLADDSPLPTNAAITHEHPVPAALTLQDIRVAHLSSDANGIGLEIAPFDEEAFGAVITSIDPNSSAAQNPNIRLNDIIVEVDGINVLDVEYEGIVELLMSKKQHTLTLSSDLDLLAAGSVDRRVVELVSPMKEYGLTLEALQDEDAIRVASLDPNGPAALSGQVFVDDIVEVVNNEFVAGRGVQEVLSMVEQHETVELVLIGGMIYEADVDHRDHISYEGDAVSGKHKSPPGSPELPGLRKVQITRSKNGLGLHIAKEDSIAGVVVANIAENGACAANGEVCVGDVISSINGTSVENMELDDVCQILRTCGKRVVLTLSPTRVDVRMPDGSTPTPAALRTITLERTAEVPKYGIHFVTTDGNVRVCDILPCSAADYCGDIYPGDVVVAVNGEVMEGKSQAEVVKAIRDTDVVSIVLDADASPLPENNDIVAEDLITLERAAGESLGFSFETFDNTPGVFVKRLRPDGIAERDGRLKLGDRIVEVNGIDMMFADHTQVLTLLGDKATSRFDIHVLRISSETEVDQGF